MQIKGENEQCVESAPPSARPRSTALAATPQPIVSASL